MTEREICRSYHNAKNKAQQIRILAELNAVDSLEIIKILSRVSDTPPNRVHTRTRHRADPLDREIIGREREYKAIAAAPKGER